ncbi:hypothetical protein SE1_02178 [Enterococcus hirae EnGen0127]|uniref:hypothetical protein n=1 Tax=Enterococcus hirae TaxID=1354 RepID=UPI00032EEE86|nr:hypothetical protein [Enterococcus hirae]EOF56459.1 hypothetical protein SE1_02178 [Enterococcus hirae EnGen0127]OWW46079.1 hypothetical protein F522_08235 [Enterococcus hirae 81-15-F4]OWW59994.1 hypothetical protein B645_08105 [Enterococcus hirae 88-15-E09]
MTQTRMIVDTKSILELPMYNQENVLRYLEKDHVEMATHLKHGKKRRRGSSRTIKRKEKN